MRIMSFVPLAGRGLGDHALLQAPELATLETVPGYRETLDRIRRPR